MVNILVCGFVCVKVIVKIRRPAAAAAAAAVIVVLQEIFHQSGISMIFSLALLRTRRKPFQYHKLSTGS